MLARFRWSIVDNGRFLRSSVPAVSHINESPPAGPLQTSTREKVTNFCLSPSSARPHPAKPSILARTFPFRKIDLSADLLRYRWLFEPLGAYGHGRRWLSRGGRSSTCCRPLSAAHSFQYNRRHKHHVLSIIASLPNSPNALILSRSLVRQRSRTWTAVSNGVSLSAIGKRRKAGFAPCHPTKPFRASRSTAC